MPRATKSYGRLMFPGFFFRGKEYFLSVNSHSLVVLYFYFLTWASLKAKLGTVEGSRDEADVHH